MFSLSVAAGAGSVCVSGGGEWFGELVPERSFSAS